MLSVAFITFVTSFSFSSAAAWDKHTCAGSSLVRRDARVHTRAARAAC